LVKKKKHLYFFVLADISVIILALKKRNLYKPVPAKWSPLRQEPKDSKLRDWIFYSISLKYWTFLSIF